MYLVDTSIIIDWLRSRRRLPSRAGLLLLQALMEPDAGGAPYLSAYTRYEIERGDPSELEYVALMAAVLPVSPDLLPLAATCHRALQSGLRHRRPNFNELDFLIACDAVLHGVTLYTADAGQADLSLLPTPDKSPFRVVLVTGTKAAPRPRR